jgi:hypothetical protein
MNDLNLSDKEKKWLRRLETDDSGSIFRYVVGGLLICVSIYYLVLAGNNNDIHKAVLYGIIGGALIGVQYTYKIYFKIIKKMRDYIEEKDKTNIST